MVEKTPRKDDPQQSNEIESDELTPKFVNRADRKQSGFRRKNPYTGEVPKQFMDVQAGDAFDEVAEDEDSSERCDAIARHLVEEVSEVLDEIHAIPSELDYSDMEDTKTETPRARRMQQLEKGGFIGLNQLVSDEDLRIMEEIQKGDMKNIEKLSVIVPSVMRHIVENWEGSCMSLRSLKILDDEMASLLALWDGVLIELASLEYVGPYTEKIMENSRALTVVMNGRVLKDESERVR